MINEDNVKSGWYKSAQQRTAFVKQASRPRVVRLSVTVWTEEENTKKVDTGRKKKKKQQES